jgi:hypothetical protein
MGIQISIDNGNKQSKNPLKIILGVRQGCPLSSMLFIRYPGDIKIGRRK